MRPSQLGTVTKTARLALRFLAWAGLVGAPAACPAGHPWGPCESKKRRYLPFHCTHKEASGHRGGRGRRAPPRPPCNKKKSWRAWCPLAGQLPDSVGPQELVELLFWFSQLQPIQSVSCWTGVERGTVRRAFQVFRAWLASHLASRWVDPLGGPGLVVVVDEACVTKIKRSRALRGRHTAPMHTWLLAGVELDLATRRLTGRCFLRPVRNRRRETIERVLRAVLRPGAEVWTDEWASYSWIGAEGSGFVRHAVCHSRGEFVDAAGRGTNAIEGLFSRVRRALRRQDTRFPARGDYGPQLAEFAWRLQFPA
jgi:hypothetical protein